MCNGLKEMEISCRVNVTFLLVFFSLFVGICSIFSPTQSTYDHELNDLGLPISLLCLDCEPLSKTFGYYYQLDAFSAGVYLKVNKKHVYTNIFSLTAHFIK